MSEISVKDNDDIELTLPLKEARLLVQLLGRFHPDSVGPLNGLYEELIDAGVEPFENTLLLTQSEPTLHWVLVQNEPTQPLDNDPDVV